MPTATKPKSKSTRARKPSQAQPETLSVVYPNTRTGSGAIVDQNRVWMWSAIYRAWSIISQSIASLEIEVRKKEFSNGRIKRPMVLPHPVYTLLEESPNGDQTPYAWKEYVGLCLVQWGNYYGVIERTKGTTGDPAAIWSLAPNRVKVDRRPDGQLQYTYTATGGESHTYSPAEIVHVQLLGDGVVGKSPIALARETIGLALATEAAGASLFGNGMMPSGIFTHPGKLSPTGKKNVEEYLDRFVGPGKNRRVMVLQEGLAYTQIGIPPEDAQFLQTRDFQVAEIGRWYGVPPHMLGEVKDSKYASITPLQIEFVVYTLKHYALRIAQELTRKLLPAGSGMFVTFDTDDLMKGDPESQSKFLREMWGMGAYSLNEVREKIGEDSIGDEGDKRAVPVNFTTLEKLGEDKPQSQPFGAAGPGNGGDQGTPENGAPRAGLAMVFRDAAGRIVHRELGLLRKLVAKHEAPADLDTAMREFFRDHEAYVRDNLAPVWKGFAAVMGLSADVDRGVSRYVSDSRETLLQALRDGGRDTLTRVIEAWQASRADSVTERFMEAAFLN